MAFPTDDDCYPLVPDDISFKEADLEDSKVISEISIKAHKISRDCDHYIELADINKRITLK